MCHVASDLIEGFLLVLKDALSRGNFLGLSLL